VGFSYSRILVIKVRIIWQFGTRKGRSFAVLVLGTEYSTGYHRIPTRIFIFIAGALAESFPLCLKEV
jgi:hypothetical protein